jgi:DNA polymerase III delta prime subunit
VSSGRFNIINEAAKNDSLTQENVDNVFSKAKTREIDRIAIREKALELETIFKKFTAWYSDTNRRKHKNVL